MIESARGLNFWRRRVADSCLQARVLCAASGPLKLVLRFRLPRPKSAPKRGNGLDLAAKRPDLSKLVRAVEGAVTGVLYRDDSQIVQIDAEKSVGREGKVPGVKVEVWSVELPARREAIEALGSI